MSAGALVVHLNEKAMLGGSVRNYRILQDLRCAHLDTPHHEEAALMGVRSSMIRLIAAVCGHPRYAKIRGHGWDVQEAGFIL